MTERDGGMPGFIMGRSITVKYDEPGHLTCRIYFNGQPTAVSGRRANYDAPFRFYVDRCPDNPILQEIEGWGMVGGISMLLEALAAREDTP